MDYLQVLMLALMPAAGNFAGGLFAELVPTTRRTLSRALHMAAGIVVAVVGVELLPEALGGAPVWLVMLGFVLGGAMFIGLDAALERLNAGTKTAGAWMIYAAVFIDLFSDGLMIGAGSAVSFSLALVLAIGQVTADIPEGFAAIANFRDKGLQRGKRLALAASFVIATILGASISYWLLRDQSEALKLTALAFTAGLLILAAVEEMLTEAHESAEDTRTTAAFFLGGFVLFTLIAGYFEA
ncbi:ZIP family metal transporter [Chelativorans intermedius]|uniref:ZIP family metal transporter n=1 Tax=Chelativorans intermedius TaxID=515947 RepID=A0ABV6DC03_9HYPH|nr:ZIP family metal transporter [Chelativorans intermedius]MCT9000310.1 ZIP family metal transporter [Chelativorans intermedius]